MDSVKRKKYLTIALSIVAAVVLWFYVVDGENPTQTQLYTDVPIEIMNVNTLESKNLTLGSIETKSITVKLEGKRGNLHSIKKEDIIASIDVGNYTEGEYYAEIKVHVPSSVSVAEIKPSQIRLKVEKIVTQDKDVEVIFEGDVPDKREAVCTEMSTQIVSISGASSQVDLVEKVVARVDAAKLKETETQLISSLTPVDASGNKVSNVTVSINELSLTAQLYTVKTVKLEVSTVGKLPANLELASIIAPEVVQIAGKGADVEKIEKVSALPINLSEITSSQDVEIVLDISGSIRLAKAQKAVTVEVTVRKMDNQSLSYGVESISVKGLEDGLKINFDAQSVSLVAYGTETALKEISTQDFNMAIDCKGLSVGKHEIPVDITVSQAAKDAGISVDPMTVIVHIV